MKNTIAAALAACPIVACFFGATNAISADAGWGIQFHYDAFADETYPMGVMSEQSEQPSVDYANLFLACKDGKVGVIFQPERYGLSFDITPTPARFRGGDTVLEFSFAVTEFPAFGKHRAVTGKEAEDLLTIFDGASGPVAFESGNKQGNFPIAGFHEVRAIMQEHCAPLASTDE